MHCIWINPNLTYHQEKTNLELMCLNTREPISHIFAKIQNLRFVLLFNFVYLKLTAQMSAFSTLDFGSSGTYY